MCARVYPPYQCVNTPCVLTLACVCVLIPVPVYLCTCVPVCEHCMCAPSCSQHTAYSIQRGFSLVVHERRCYQEVEVVTAALHQPASALPRPVYVYINI
jgi:hypothetical protein